MSRYLIIVEETATIVAPEINEGGSSLAKRARMGLENLSWRSTALIPQLIKIYRRERPTNTSRSFGCRKLPRAEVPLRAKSAARNPFVLSLQQERVQRQIDPIPTASPNPAPQLGTDSLKRLRQAGVGALLCFPEFL